MIFFFFFFFFGKWRISPEHSVIFPFERKITMADFGKLKEKGAACMWTKRGLCSSGGWLVFFGREDDLRRDFFWEVRLRFSEGDQLTFQRHFWGCSLKEISPCFRGILGAAICKDQSVF